LLIEIRQTEEEQVNIIETSDPITPMYIGNFASGTDSMDSDAEIENHERQLVKQGTNIYFSNSVSLGKLTVHIGNCNVFFYV
jgi:hypothetical protein